MYKTILHIIDTTGPGGAETIFTQLAKHSQEIGLRTIALIRGPGWVKNELKRLGIETRIIDSKGSFNFSFLKRLIDLINSEKVDLIQAHLLGSGLYASMAGIMTRCPVYTTFHGFVDIPSHEKLLFFKFLIIQLGSNKIIAVTNKLGKKLQRIPGIQSKRIKIIPNGINTCIFEGALSASIKNESNIPVDSFLVGCLGNVRKAKNYKLAIDTLHELRQAGINAKLIIAGDDQNSLANNHKLYAENLSVAQHVIWLGFITNTPGFLKALDVFLLTSTTEGHPLALTQAMAAGVPIVTTKCGVEEILTHRQTAMIADNNSPEQLAEYIIELQNTKIFREKIVANARSTARMDFSLTAMCKNYEEMYKQNLH